MSMPLLSDGPNVVVDDDLVTGWSFADVDAYFQVVCAAAHQRRIR
jgi:hypothetical protein